MAGSEATAAPTAMDLRKSFRLRSGIIILPMVNEVQIPPLPYWGLCFICSV
jgi:hypothetical protein